VPDLKLSAVTPLGDLRRDFAGTSLAEVSGKALVSIAIPCGGEVAMAKAVSGAYGIKPPAIGSSAESRDGAARFLGLQSDQFFLLFDHSGDRAVEVVSGKLGDAGYYTDQSDSWAMLRLAGPQSLAALERICPLDLDVTAFPPGAVGRTAMEHLGAIILREPEDTFLLLSARSSARSFLHAVETSLVNVS
jgi:heterotetrameric sarcosine oxidase gamma subunit